MDSTLADVYMDFLVAYSGKAVSSIDRDYHMSLINHIGAYETIGLPDYEDLNVDLDVLGDDPLALPYDNMFIVGTSRDLVLPTGNGIAFGGRISRYVLFVKKTTVKRHDGSSTEHIVAVTPYGCVGGTWYLFLPFGIDIQPFMEQGGDTVLSTIGLPLYDSKLVVVGSQTFKDFCANVILSMMANLSLGSSLKGSQPEEKHEPLPSKSTNEFKTLVLTVGERKPVVKPRGPLGKPRRSPRTYTKRSYVVRTSTGIRIVPETIVNPDANGTVEKEYIIDPALEGQEGLRFVRASSIKGRMVGEDTSDDDVPDDSDKLDDTLNVEQSIPLEDLAQSIATSLVDNPMQDYVDVVANVVGTNTVNIVKLRTLVKACIEELQSNMIDLNRQVSEELSVAREMRQHAEDELEAVRRLRDQERADAGAE